MPVSEWFCCEAERTPRSVAGAAAGAGREAGIEVSSLAADRGAPPFRPARRFLHSDGMTKSVAL